MSLKRKAFAGAAWTSAARIGERASVFVIMLVLLRLLDVKEFGTATTAVMIITVLWPVARFGSFNYVIQHQDPDDAVLTGASMATLYFSVLATVLLAAAAIPLSWAFSDPKLAPAVFALSPVFIIKSLGTVPEGILTKRFGFRALAFRQLASVIIGGVAAIIAAFIGWGVYALIVQQLVMALVATVMVGLSARWKLDIAGGRKHVREVWSMGSKYTLAQLLSSVNLSGYGLVIGLFLGTSEAGLFRLAFAAVDLCTQITIQPLVNVALPVFARFRDDQQKLRDAYLGFLQVTSIGSFVIFAWMAVMGPDLGRLMYGARFEAAAPLIPIFSIVVFAATSNYIIGALLSATGRAGEQARLAAAQAACALVLAMVSAPFGLMFAAMGHVLRSIITTPMSYFYLRRSTLVTWQMTLGKLAWPLVAALISVIPILLLKRDAMFVDLPIVLRLASSAVIVGTVYFAFLVTVRPHLFLEMVAIVSPRISTGLGNHRLISKFLRFRGGKTVEALPK